MEQDAVKPGPGEQWWEDEAREGELTHDKYKYYMRPEPRENLGPIETAYDELTGNDLRSRMVGVPMIRGGVRKPLRVYLDPLPHIRIRDAKPLQGWYQAKHWDGDETGSRSRPRPCMTDAILTEPYGGYCFPAGTMVETPEGAAPIENLRPGDLVLGREGDRIVAVEVEATMDRWVERLVEVRLDDGGRIRSTPDHPIYSRARRDYVNAEDLSLGEELEGLSRLRGTNGEAQSRVLSPLQVRAASDADAASRYQGVPKVPGLRSAGDPDWDPLRDLLLGDFAGEWTSPEGQTRSLGRQGAVSRDSGKAPKGEYRKEAFSLHTGALRSTRSGLGAAVASSTRNPRVVRVEPVIGGARVYDIQTTSVNFYIRPRDGQASVLVHNCAVGCSFCYINSGFKGYRGSGLISVPVNFGQQVWAMLASMKTGTAGYFSSFTDPFLPLEDLYHNTREGAEAFDRAGLPVFFLSRLHYPGWAFDLLESNGYSYMQKSINCADEATWHRLSPGAISLADHMEEIREARRRGIYVSIQVNPILPGVVDHDHVVRVFEMLAQAGVNHVIVKFVEAGYSWADTMIERTRKRFPDERADRFEALFTQNIGGQRTIAESYRLEGHRRYSKAAAELGLTYATCYEYRYERDYRGAVKSKVGVSIGSDFLTADQCHGHRVPMFTRTDLGQPFREIEACPPAGCLTCARGDDPADVPCGSKLLGLAKALRFSDLKKDPYTTEV